MPRSPSRTISKADAYAPVTKSESRPLINTGESSDESSDGTFEDDYDGGIFMQALQAQGGSKFAQDLNLAVRAAFFILVCGIPFLANGVSPAIDDLVKEKVYSSGCVIFLVYTLYKTVGDTVYNAVCSLKGAFMASFYIWLLFAIFPEGAEEEFDGIWWFGFIAGAAFIFCLLWLNWDINTAVFAISTFVGYWMVFLTPEISGDFSKRFDISYDHQETSDFIVAVVGCSLAIAATLLPWPLTALDGAISIARELATAVPRTWLEFTDYIIDDSANIYEQDRIVSSLRELQAKAGDMRTLIDSSWWECFGLGTRQRIRRTLSALDRWIVESYDLQSSAWNACLASPEKWGKQHQQLMRAVDTQIRTGLKASQVLLGYCIQAACDGDIDATEEGMMIELIEQVEKAERDLSKQFHQTKKDMHIPDVSEELILEHSFCTSITIFCRGVVSFAKELINIDNLPQDIEVPGGLGELFNRSIIFDTSPTGHLNFVLRNYLALMLGFLIGYFGYKDLLVAHSASISCTASLLMSKALGSAVVKNLQRVQGVVLGTVVGQVLHRLFGNCVAYNEVILGAILFAYSAGNLFLYYNSVSYSYVGCLLAAFGASKMLGGCITGNFNPKATYDAIVTTIIAVSLILLMDLIFSRKRASDMSHEALEDTWNFMTTALRKDFSPKAQTVPFNTGELLAKINSADSWGKEAYFEPRYWRTPWQDRTFDSVIVGTRNIRYDICSIEGVLAESYQDGAAKRALFLKLQQREDFQLMTTIVMEKLASVQTLLNFFVHETPERMQEFDKPEATREFRYEELAAMRAFLKEGNASGIFKSESCTTLADDVACQVCTILGNLNALIFNCRQIQHAILQS